MEISAVKKWVEQFVVGRNLCPFAGRELAKDRVRFIATKATSEQQLLDDLNSEFTLLLKNNEIETTLLIHSQVLQNFYDYNEFLNAVDCLIVDRELEGVFQVASFHPDYQFAGAGVDDAENFTNRSPFPVLHILREESVEQAIAVHPDAEKIPSRNIRMMNEIGKEELSRILNSFTSN